MITAAQVADLQPGDVVELTSTTWPDGAIRGPLRQNGEYEALVLNSPCLGETYVIRNAQGDPSCADERTLTVVSRAPRPLYVNHPRTKPVPGDVVRSADDDDDVVYVYASPGREFPWLLPVGDRDALLYMSRSVLPTRLRLLVDGEDGDIVLTVQS